MRGHSFAAYLGCALKKQETIKSILGFLLILALFSSGPVWMPASTEASSLRTFGNTDVGNLVNSFSTNKDASVFQLSESGIIQSITVYFASSRFNSKASIYDDSNGVPGNLIAQSSSQYISAAGWHVFSVPQKSLSWTILA